MRDTNRSLWFAVLACVAMGLFARSPRFAGGNDVVTIALFIATLALSATGFWIGLRGARRQRTLWSWLAPGINAFVFIAFIAFFVLILRALMRMN